MEPAGNTVVSRRTVTGALRDGAKRHPDRVFLVFDDLAGNVTTYTWREVLERSWALALYLQEAGLQAGGRVHVHLANRPEFLFTWFAVAELGAVMVPTNVACSEVELGYIIGHAEAEMSITDAEREQVVLNARRRSGTKGAVFLCERDGLGALPPGEDRGHRADPQALLSIMYTSGTTAKPKGVLVNHANYLYAGEVLAKGIRLGPDDRVLTVLPLFHANAQYYTTMGTLVAGGTIVLCKRFSASRFMDQVAGHGVTVASLFAAPIRMILAQAEAPSWREHALRLVLFAQNLTEQELDAWDERVGAPLLQLYGMTETMGPPLINPVDGGGRHDAVGRVSLGYTCSVVRPDGTSAAVDEPGQLLVKGIPGVSLTAGYLNDKAATDSVLKSEWLETGDIVRVDGDGFHYFVDREKDMIKRSGENVAASEVESVVGSHPAVRDVAVVGVPDPIRDEQIVAFVVPVEDGGTDPEELAAWCEERLASFRVPGSFHLVAELPRTSVGKIQKGLLRERACRTSAQP